MNTIMNLIASSTKCYNDSITRWRTPIDLSLDHISFDLLDAERTWLSINPNNLSVDEHLDLGLYISDTTTNATYIPGVWRELYTESAIGAKEVLKQLIKKARSNSTIEQIKLKLYGSNKYSELDMDRPLCYTGGYRYFLIKR